MKDWKRGDVIQIDPNYDEKFGGCLLVVEDVKNWGVQGFTQVPDNPTPNRAYYRLPYESGEKIGALKWQPEW